MRCSRCGGRRSPYYPHACRVQLHPDVTDYLADRQARPAGVVTPSQAAELEAWFDLDLDAPLDAYLDGRS